MQELKHGMKDPKMNEYGAMSAIENTTVGKEIKLHQVLYTILQFDIIILI